MIRQARTDSLNVFFFFKLVKDAPRTLALGDIPTEAKIRQAPNGVEAVAHRPPGPPSPKSCLRVVLTLVKYARTTARKNERKKASTHTSHEERKQTRKKDVRKNTNNKAGKQASNHAR